MEVCTKGQCVKEMLEEQELAKNEYESKKCDASISDVVEHYATTWPIFFIFSH